jgi:hypothetical protein
MAQVVEPPQLTEYREAFELGLAVRMKPVSEAYAKSLANLENLRAIREDYEGALRAQNRRLQLETGKVETAGVATSTLPAGAIELSMGDGADINGSSILRDNKRSALTGFKKAGHSVSWDLIKVNPGWYKIMATYGCAAPYKEKRERADRVIGDNTPVDMKAGGSFTIYEETGLIADTSPPVSKTVVSTGSWDKLVTRNIGRIKLTGTTTRLKLEVVSAENLGIMYLHDLVLIPDETGNAAGGLSEDAKLPEALRMLRSQYKSQVEVGLKDMIMAYVRELKLLEDLYTNGTELEKAIEIRAERMRVQPLLDDPTALLKK